MWSSEDRYNRGPRLWYRETPDGIVSHSLAWLGWPLVAGGVALLTFVLTGSPQRGSLWVPLAVGGGFAVAGVLFAIARQSFALNWSQRTWHATRGTLCWTKDSQGTFDDFAAVVLSEHRRPIGTRPARFWVIGITFRDKPILVDLCSFFSREKAQVKCHYLAHKMGIPALDTSER